MESRIDHKLIQQKWTNNRSYQCLPDNRTPFSITLPPPNVTGQLHQGHFLNGSMHDMIARRKRQEGYNVCFKCGMDHAGLATQEISEIINFDIMNQYYHKQTTAVINDVINK
jgi:valyl-tRNA synthetase